MNYSFLNYSTTISTQASISKTRPNYLYSILSVALVLFLLGFFALLLLHAQELIRLYKEQVNIIIELEEGVEQAQIDQLVDTLGQMAPILQESVTHLSKDMAAELMNDDFGEDFQQLGLPNPFTDMVTFNVAAEYLQPDSLVALQYDISQMPAVQSVYYQDNFLEEVSKNMNTLGYIAIGLSIFFFVVAVTLIHNTIRLALYANRFLIKNMQLVGASWFFISRPYLLRALGHGFIASVLAISALSGILLWVRKDIPQLLLIENTMLFVYLLLLLIPLGMLLYGLSTYRVVNKYLTMRVDDMY